jgi:hypothetical protein
MPRTRRISFAGTEIEVEDVNVVSSREDFNEYVLEDGRIVKVKSVLTTLAKVVGAESTDGKPVFIVTVSPVILVP